jgi:hypothetical protein
MSDESLPDGWRSIATAPRDGTWFLICRAGEPESVEAGCYQPLTHSSFELVDADRELYRKYEYPAYDWVGFCNFHRATHWIALPPIPEAA